MAVAIIGKGKFVHRLGVGFRAAKGYLLFLADIEIRTHL
jgi:hypothetical protein